MRLYGIDVIANYDTHVIANYDIHVIANLNIQDIGYSQFLLFDIPPPTDFHSLSKLASSRGRPSPTPPDGFS